jgi:hypothetical protein
LAHKGKKKSSGPSARGILIGALVIFGLLVVLIPELQLQFLAGLSSLVVGIMQILVPVGILVAIYFVATGKHRR